MVLQVVSPQTAEGNELSAEEFTFVENLEEEENEDDQTDVDSNTEES